MFEWRIASRRGHDLMALREIGRVCSGIRRGRHAPRRVARGQRQLAALVRQEEAGAGERAAVRAQFRVVFLARHAPGLVARGVCQGRGPEVTDNMQALTAAR